MTRTMTLSALAIAAAMPMLAAAQQPAVVQGDLMPGWRAGGVHHAGLHLTLAPGWKTYWRAPGDAGIPPVFDWTGSDNLAGVDVLFPTPQVFDQQGMRSLGYADAVTFPMRVTPVDPGAPVALTGVVDLGVCSDICVPARLTVTATLPATGGAAKNKRIEAALRAMPTPAAKAGVTSVTCQFDPIKDGVRVTAQVAMPSIGKGEVAAIETAVPGVWVSEPDVSRRGDTLSMTADLVPPAAAPFFLARDAVRITVIGGGQAVDIQGCD